MTHGEYSAQENLNFTNRFKTGKFCVGKSAGKSSDAQVGCEENSIAHRCSAQNFAA
jgi:hypothetical protein